MAGNIGEMLNRLLKNLGIEDEVGDIPDQCWYCSRWNNPGLIYQCPIYKQEGKCPWLQDALQREQNEIERYGVPRRIIEIIYSNPLDTKVFIEAKAHFRHLLKGGCLLIFGPVGIGKSIAMARLFIGLERARPIWTKLFVSAREINWKSLATIQELQLLAIDDLGLESNPDVMKQIFERRYDMKLATMATSNLTPTQFRSKYGERVLDRLREWGISVVVEGKSLRSQKNESIGTGKNS